MAYSQNSSEIILQLGGMDAPESEIQQSGQQECDEQATHLDLDTCEHMETAVSDDKPSLQDNTPLLDDNIQTLLDIESCHTSNHHQLQPRIIRVRRDGTPEPKPKLRRMTKHISDDEVAFALGQHRSHLVFLYRIPKNCRTSHLPIRPGCTDNGGCEPMNVSHNSSFS